MDNPRSLIIGAGEIGKSLHKVIKQAKWSVAIRDVDPVKTKKVHVLHIAFPYNDNFIQQVRDYIEQYNPILTIIYSTLPIGTCEKIAPSIVHSPVEGRHPHLEDSIRLGVRWLGSSDANAQRLAVDFWQPLVEVIRVMNSPAFTELLKLRSTAKYGINLVWTDYEKHLADLVGMEHGAIKQFDADYNTLYSRLGYPQFQRYILDPPEGFIGGHCVVPNAGILDEQYPHPMLKMIKKMKGKK